MDIEEFVKNNKINKHKTEFTRSEFNKQEYIEELERYRLQKED